jgi:predicted phage-related endonuclease
MTKEEVLQKVNDYCNEKSYTTATLTDAFKDKFADHFAKRFPDANADDETALTDMKFALNTAFSGASLIITDKTKEFETKENDYKSKIAELEKKVKTPPTPTPELPKDVQDKLNAYESFMNEEKKSTKFKSVIALAKQDIRQDLHSSFEEFAKDFAVNLDKEDKEQADALVARFKTIFKSTIGDIAPLKPQQTQQQEQDYIASLPKVKVQ